MFLPVSLGGVVCHICCSLFNVTLRFYPTQREPSECPFLLVLRSLTTRYSAGLFTNHGRRHRNRWIQTAPMPPARYMLGLAPNWGQTSGIVCGSLYPLCYTCVADRAACGLSDIVSVHGVFVWCHMVFICICVGVFLPGCVCGVVCHIFCSL